MKTISIPTTRDEVTQSLRDLVTKSRSVARDTAISAMLHTSRASLRLADRLLASKSPGDLVAK